MACGDSTPGIVVDAPVGSEPLQPARLTASPLSVDFGSASITTVVLASLTVTNVGKTASGPLTTSVTGTQAASFATVGTPCTTLAPDATCTLSLEFAPSTVGAKIADLHLTASPGGFVMVALSGVALSGPGGIYVNPSSHNFGTVPTGTPSAASTFTIVNSGSISTGALTVTPAGANANDFAISSQTCGGAVVAPAGSCTFDVVFTPTLIGARSASFVVSTSIGGTVTAAVSGIGE